MSDLRTGGTIEVDFTPSHKKKTTRGGEIRHSVDAAPDSTPARSRTITNDGIRRSDSVSGCRMRTAPRENPHCLTDTEAEYLPLHDRGDF